MPKGEYLQYGGQALIEGVMMRSPRYFSVACRAPNGEIVVETEALDKTWIGRQKWLRAPFLRGSLAILDSMALASKAMKFATDVQTDPKYAEAGSTPEPESPGSKRVQDAAVGLSTFVGIGLGLLLFVFVPNLIAERFAKGRFHDFRLTNLLTEAIKMLFFFGYLGLISRLPSIHRVFQYHGAEHKAINTLEAEQELSEANALAQTRLHPRCGTSFAVIVLLISVLLFTFVPRYPIPALQGQVFLSSLVRFLVELPIIPVIAGISYEMIRLAGKFRNSSFVMTLFWPGLMTQYLTTAEPDTEQVQVALAALNAVLAEEDRDAAGREAVVASA